MRNPKTPARVFNVVVAVRMYNAVGRARLEGILRFLRHGRNWRIKLIETEDHFSDETITNARKDGVDGFILFQKLSSDLWKRLIEAKVPIVSLESVCPHEVKRGRYVHLVHMNDEGIGSLAAEHLLAAGDFRAFGFVPSFLKETWSTRRQKGFVAAIRAEGKKCHIFTPSKDTTLDNESALINWLTSLPSPCAIYAANDLIATRVLAACDAAGLNVPRKVAILGTDNDEILCLNAIPSLSSIRYVTEKEGELIAAHLEQMMLGAHTDKNLLTWDFKEVVPRESTSFTTPAAQLIRRALLHIDRYATDGLKAQDVARELGVSQRLLELRFSQLENQTVAQAIDNRRFAELTRLLRNTTAPIAQVASSSGFGSLPHLTRRFRARYGMSMTAWQAKEQAPKQKPSN